MKVSLDKFAETFLGNAEMGKDVYWQNEDAMRGDARVPRLVRALKGITKHESKVELLGAGSFGTAAALSTTHVAKLTTDASEVQAGAVLVAKRLPHVTRVYASYFTKDVFVRVAVGWDAFNEEAIYSNERAGILLVERVTPIDKSQRVQLSRLVNEFKQEHELYPSQLMALPAKEQRNRLNWASGELERRLRNSSGERKLFEGVADALRELREIGIFAIDVHGGNVGHDAEGTVKVFDIGSSSPPGKPKAKVFGAGEGLTAEGVRVPVWAEEEAIVAWHQPFDLAKLRLPRPQMVRDKPDGVWYAVGREWLEWCEFENFRCGSYIYALDIDYARVLRLSTVKAVLDFGQKFGVTRHGNRKIIDWPAVAQQYAGVEIAPYQPELRFDRRVEWYYTWDVASGCIWEPGVIRGVKPLDKTGARESARLSPMQAPWEWRVTFTRPDGKNYMPVFVMARTNEDAVEAARQGFLEHGISTEGFAVKAQPMMHASPMPVRHAREEEAAEDFPSQKEAAHAACLQGKPSSAVYHARGRWHVARDTASAAEAHEESVKAAVLEEKAPVVYEAGDPGGIVWPKIDALAKSLMDLSGWAQGDRVSLTVYGSLDKKPDWSFDVHYGRGIRYRPGRGVHSGVSKIHTLPARKLTMKAARELARVMLEEARSPRAHEEVSEARDAGPYATMQRPPGEAEAGRALGAIRNPHDLYNCLEALRHESQEVFVVVPVTVHGEPCCPPVEIARGQRDRVSVDHSDVLRPVIATNAVGFYVAHSHPSGHAKPSQADLDLTESIRASTKKALPNVVFLDHLVVTSTEFFSIQEGKLYKA